MLGPVMPNGMQLSSHAHVRMVTTSSPVALMLGGAGAAAAVHVPCCPEDVEEMRLGMGDSREEGSAGREVMPCTCPSPKLGAVRVNGVYPSSLSLSLSLLCRAVLRT